MGLVADELGLPVPAVEFELLDEVPPLPLVEPLVCAESAFEVAAVEVRISRISLSVSGVGHRIDVYLAQMAFNVDRTAVLQQIFQRTWMLFVDMIALGTPMNNVLATSARRQPWPLPPGKQCP